MTQPSMTIGSNDNYSRCSYIVHFLNQSGYCDPTYISMCLLCETTLNLVLVISVIMPNHQVISSPIVAVVMVHQPAPPLQIAATDTISASNLGNQSSIGNSRRGSTSGINFNHCYSHNSNSKGNINSNQ
ncbi:hypothetical protein ACTA71_012056 [Dictyostelium dimigraforme]